MGGETLVLKEVERKAGIRRVWEGARLVLPPLHLPSPTFVNIGGELGVTLQACIPSLFSFLLRAARRGECALCISWDKVLTRGTEEGQEWRRSRDSKCKVG